MVGPAGDAGARVEDDVRPLDNGRQAGRTRRKDLGPQLEAHGEIGAPLAAMGRDGPRSTGRRCPRRGWRWRPDPPRHHRDIGRGVVLHLRRPALDDRARSPQQVPVVVGDQQGGERPNAELMAGEAAEAPVRGWVGEALPLARNMSRIVLTRADSREVAEPAISLRKTPQNWRLQGSSVKSMACA